MSTIRYKPRLKKGILQNKRFLLAAKNLNTLKKKKWRFFLKKYNSLYVLEPLIRNDLFLIQNKILDLRKEYKRVLSKKQEVSAFFNTLRGKTLKKIFLLECNSNSPIDNVLIFLELRIDIILLRANFVKTFQEARWLIASGFVLVNEKPMRFSSFTSKIGDYIRIIKKSENQIPLFFKLTTFNLALRYLEINYDTFSLVVSAVPNKRSKQESLKLYSFFLGVAGQAAGPRRRPGR